ncbi:MAG: SPFH domain-containing protein [Terriglobales bacterium]
MLAVSILCWGLLFAAIVIRRYIGKLTTVTLLQYQTGVIFKKGYPVREVGPGQFRVWAGPEKMFTLDKRPIVVTFENQSVALADGATAVYGFSAVAEITDASKALYSARNFNHYPFFALLCCARLSLNRWPSPALVSSQQDLVHQITGEAKQRLVGAGFNLQSFRFTHFAVASPAPQSNLPFA